ncbi:Transcriptional regulatory protein sin3, partial [Rhizopus stolonifer]
IDTPGVIERVSALFRGNPTLISGFNTFLPPGYCIECSIDDLARDVIKVTTPSGTTTTSTNSGPNFHFRNATPTFTPQQQQQQVIDEASRRPPIEFNHAINYVNKIKNRFAHDPEVYKQFLELLQTYQKDQRPITEVYSQVHVLFNGAADLLAEFKQFLPDMTSKKPTSKRRGMTHSPKQKRSKASHSNLSDIRSTSYYNEPIISTEETEFFERVRKYIGNKTTYYSFLKVLNLFCQQILDQNTLIERCESFLGGNKELFHQLKTMVGYQTQDKVIENIPAISQRPDLSGYPEYGPSYRSVPETWQEKQRCSGRDDLCKQVLNDEYVSHPTWASEDGGFIAYDYDMNIEANLNTISLLEPIFKRIQSMSEEEKSSFKLPVGLGGPSKTIYQRIIKKIYGKEQGSEVIEMLHNQPLQAVPIILKRLRQKDEEWRKSQREWNKVWREIEIKNYYKALDYQGVNFKNSDRKSMSVKALVTEIEAIRLDQEQENSHKPQFVYEFKDKALFKDVSRVLFSYFERQTVYGISDCEVMKAFIEMFLPIFFDVVDVTPQKEEKIIEDEDVDEDDDMSEEESFTREKSAEDDEQKEDEPVADDMEVDQPEKEPASVMTIHKLYTLFGNTTFYCFFRLFQMAYERLEKMKQLDKEFQADPTKSKHMSKTAIGLGANSKIFQHLQLDFDQGFYKPLLKLIEYFFDDELDQQTFEECTRYIFGTQAYTIFSIDKLMQSLIRQIYYIVSDSKAQTLLSLFKQYHEYRTHTEELENAYRLQVAELLEGDDETYNLAFNTSKRTLSIQILGRDDEPFKLHDEEGYNKYVNNYVDWEHETLGVDKNLIRPSFLKRNIHSHIQHPMYRLSSNMEYKICRNTYHLFYVIGTEDSLVSTKNAEPTNEAQDKNKRFQLWLTNKSN